MSLTSGQRKRLEKQRQRLDSDWVLRDQKVGQLKKEFAIETRVTVLFQLQQQIQEEEEALSHVTQELDTIEKQLKADSNLEPDQKSEKTEKERQEFEKNLTPIEELYRALLGLDFFEQETLFRRFIKDHSVGAWIIHGKHQYGQCWLLNRLMKRITKESNNIQKVIKVALTVKTGVDKKQATWFQIQQQFNLKIDPMSEHNIINAVCNAVYECRKTQNVIFIFHLESNSPGWLHEWLDDFINKFWKDLVKNCQNTQDSNKLLMFLVDYHGCVEKEGKKVNIIIVTDPFESSWQADVPIKLPIKKISQKDLTQWKNNQMKYLPIKLVAQDESYMKNLRDRCERGLPQAVLEAICKECDHDWYQTESIWLRY